MKPARTNSIFLLFMLTVSCQPIQKEKTAIFSEKAEKLVNKLTLEEKAAQLKTYSFAFIKPYVSETGEVNADSLKKYFPYA